MHGEQAGNIALVQRKGAGIMLPRKSLNRRRLAGALERIVTDERYRENMQHLKQLQDPIDGATNAAHEMVEFIEGYG